MVIGVGIRGISAMKKLSGERKARGRARRARGAGTHSLPALTPTPLPQPPPRGSRFRQRPGRRALGGRQRQEGLCGLPALGASHRRRPAERRHGAQLRGLAEARGLPALAAAGGPRQAQPRGRVRPRVGFRQPRGSLPGKKNDLSASPLLELPAYSSRVPEPPPAHVKTPLPDPQPRPRMLPPCRCSSW
jgi:hypothetical protein